MRRSALVTFVVLAATACDKIPTEEVSAGTGDSDRQTGVESGARPAVPEGTTVVEGDLVWTPSGAVFTRDEWEGMAVKTPWLKNHESLIKEMRELQSQASGMQLSVTGRPAPSILCHVNAFACSRIPIAVWPGAAVTFWTNDQWTSATPQAFAAFDLIYIHDGAGFDVGIAQSKARWGPAITGRVVLTGTHFEHCNPTNVPGRPEHDQGACGVLTAALEWIHGGTGPGLLASTQQVNANYLPTNPPFNGVSYAAINGGFDHVRITDPGHATMIGSTDLSLSNFINSAHSYFGTVGSFTVVAEVCRTGGVLYPNACPGGPGGFAPYFLVFSPADQDGDGIADHLDNCPTVANADQTDANGNRVGDACESAPTVSISPSTSSVASGTSITFSTTATDADDAPGDLTYVWRVGGLIQPGATGPTFTSTFALDATVRVTVRDPGNLTGFAEATVTIVTNQPPAANAGGPYSGNEGTAVAFDGSASSDPDAGDVLTYSWDFGDGSSDNTNTSTPSHTYADNGSYTVRLTVTDAGEATSSADVIATIANVSPTASFSNDGPVNEGASFTLRLENPSDPSSADVSAGFTYAFDCGTGYGVPGLGNSASCPADDNGTPSALGKILDKDGGETEYSATLAVNNVAPTVAPFTPAPLGPVAVGTTINASAAFTDPGRLDTHTGVIDWDDGSSPSAGITEANGSGSAAGSHTYATAGVYTMAVTVTDKDGGSGQSLFQYLVVYDPTAGFVTGGGWILSPAGAYAPDPALTGKATFGFVSKYQKGRTLPTGNTEFQFHAAGLNFSSTSYDWLVIAGARAQYRGTGTINGGGSYAFLLSAIDGQQGGGSGIDRFRIKIWDRASGSKVYDNQHGDSDDAPATTALGGGSIVIHSK